MTLLNLPDIFPLHEDKDFLTGREWVCLRLLCINKHTLDDAIPEELSASTNQQVELSRAKEIVNIAKIARLQGVGTWFARLMVESGLTYKDMLNFPSSKLTTQVNAHFGYAICNAKTMEALQELQEQW